MYISQTPVCEPHDAKCIKRKKDMACLKSTMLYFNCQLHDTGEIDFS